MTADGAQLAGPGAGEPGDSQQWNSDALLAEWREVGIKPGMTLVVHSALSRIGRVQGGAATVVESLRRAVGPTGTLVAPTFTPQVADPHPEVRGVPDDDVRGRRDQVPLFTSDLPSPMGAVAEALRLTPGAVRSRHPQASIAALGARAEEIVSGQPLHFAVGRESPFATLLELGGRILLVGVGHNRNSFLHHAESLIARPRLKQRRFPTLVDDERSGARPSTSAMTTTPTSPSSGGTTNAMPASARYMSATQEQSCWPPRTSCHSPAAA